MTGEVRSRGRAVGRSALVGAVVVLGVLSGVLSACQTPPTTPPYDPYALTVTLEAGDLLLEWSAPGGHSGTYRIQRRLAAGGPWEELSGVGTTSAVDADVQNRTGYYYRVAGVPSSAPVWSPGVYAYYVDPVLPVVRIETAGRAPVVDKETRIPGTMELDPNGSAYSAFSGSIEINGRGNTTWHAPKKPYRIRLGSKANLMGMGSSKHWVLLANYLDKSQLRTWVAGQASEATDLEWTPEYRHVEVVLNGQYVGVYQLAEHVRRDANRVDIEELEPTDIVEPEVTGGYLLEIDGYLDLAVDPGFVTNHSVKVQMQEPDAGVVEQETYIRDYVQDFEDALYSPQFTDPLLGYRPYLDTASLVDFYWVQELLKNQDAFVGSTYFHKHRGGPLEFGPIWDFDLSMANEWSYDELTPDGWRTWARGPWMRRLAEDPAFLAEVQARWPALKPGFEAIVSQIEPTGAGLATAIDNDEGRWSYELEGGDSPQYLAAWLQSRIDWIDAQIPQP